MKLRELKSLDFDLVMQFNEAWADEPITEGIWNNIRTEFGRIANTFSEVYKKSNTKSGLNDQVLRAIYLEELKKLKVVVDTLPDNVRNKVVAMLTKHDIKIAGGVDLSRKNLNRIMVIKIVRGLIFAMKQMKDNGLQWILSSVISGGIFTIISLIMDAKDYKEIGTEFIKSSKQIKTLIDKANE